MVVCIWKRYESWNYLIFITSSVLFFLIPVASSRYHLSIFRLSGVFIKTQSVSQEMFFWLIDCRNSKVRHIFSTHAHTRLRANFSPRKSSQTCSTGCDFHTTCVTPFIRPSRQRKQNGTKCHFVLIQKFSKQKIQFSTNLNSTKKCYKK